MSKFVSAKNFFKGFSKVFKGPQHEGRVATIGGVKPNVPKTAAEKAKSKLKILKQKTKGSQAKLDQAIFNLQEQNRAFKKDRVKKMGGGMMGRRFGMKMGTPKTNVQKIKETFGPKKKVPNKFKGFSKLPEKVQQKIDAKLAKKV